MELRAEKPMLLKGDCLELMKTLPAKSVDLFLCDLPYGETNCSWDTKINMAEFWKEFKRIRRSKRTACIHFCSTGFGYSLIKSWEKGFKMDMVWKKRNKTGGLQSRYRPMRNHEMIYFFYEQAPKYNRDKYHKRIKSPNTCVVEEDPNVNEDGKSAHGGDKDHVFGDANGGRGFGGTAYGKQQKEKGIENHYTPLLPASVQEEGKTIWGLDKKDNFKTGTSLFENQGNVNHFDPPNPASVQEEGKTIWGLDKKDNGKTRISLFEGKGKVNHFDPPNPASVQEEQEDLFGEKPTERRNRRKEKGSGGAYEHDPPNPASVQEDNSIDIFDEIEEPHLAPFSVYEGTKCFIGKRNHQTEKPQDILEFILKYWTDEGDVVLDPTMGSGSTGVACKKMGRSFIGIELTDKYYEVANQRINPELGKGCE